MQWPKNMLLIDANVVLRCILNDNPEMVKKAVEIINSGAYTKPEFIAEVVYVLQKVYLVPRSNIKNMISHILELIECSDKECIIYAINLYSEMSLDFADCLLIAYNRINHENVFTFDKKLNKKLNEQ